MSVATVALPAPLVLVPGMSLDERLRQRAGTSAGLPADVLQIVTDLNRMEGGAPAHISPASDRFKASLLVHTRTYRLRLEVTRRGTGYFVKTIDPLRLADHARLARSCLLLRPPAWHMVLDLTAVPEGSDGQWQQIEDAWRDLGQVRAEQQGVAPPSDAQTEFLDTVDRLIDATEEITTREQRGAAPFPYQQRTATGGRRSTPQSMYEFQLVANESPASGDFVRVQGDEDARGRVTRAVGKYVTVRFDRPVSWERLPDRGALERTPNTVVHNKQRQAVAALRAQDTKNPGLLPALVEGRVRTVPDSPARPHQELDPEQLAAFRKALATQDILVVLGPPGTGKTRTITEMAHTSALTTAAGGGRVLITSHTNRAVDNALARLPRDLVVVRVGDEGNVHADVKPLLLEEQRESLSQEIRSAMTARAQAYREAEAATPWTAELDTRLDRAEILARQEEAAAVRLRTVVQEAGAPARQTLAALCREEDEQAAEWQRLSERATWLQEKSRSDRRRADSWLLGWLYRSRLRRQEEERGALDARLRELAGVRPERRRRIEAARTAVDRAVDESPAVLSVRTARDTAERQLRTAVQAAYEAADMAVMALCAVLSEPTVPTRQLDPADAMATLRSLHGRLKEWLPLAAERSKLTEQWNAAIDEDPGQLVPELIRYAQVIGATCIGAASRAELAGVDFDLGIIDEAGQIGVADALVPLTRVRRGVLVGDDRQLPPFLDSEVAEWGRETGDPALLEMMSQSALERLRAGLPASHVVQLTRQRRMPAEIADFISATFYRNELVTEKEHRHTDPLFASPMAFVDTAGLPVRERRETAGRRAEERLGHKGAFNTCEARLLARLAAFYHRRGSEWVVIVPYRAQRAEVIRHLTPLIGDSQLAASSVGSVDSYQGGERDVVLYGFTRSNAQGRVGFLAELRRVNVAFTRAKSLLVMTGDLGTLLGADDPAFRSLADDLHRYLRDHGDVRDYRDVMSALDAAAPAPEGDRP
ncbi:DEAD/DEAH box helicase [Streptomyces sp. NPDC017941]|uniref:DEAD/DEAH box helicase n=1 Tax=Streptomyces sp. NPDC017941 TaxID=3365018 RepID=UPI0037AB02C7